MSGVLASRGALVTGASSGIGREIASHLAAAGATVVLVGRNRERLSEAAEQISNEGGTAHTVEADLREASDRDKVVSEAVTRLGAIDVLVHSAGVYKRSAFTETGSESLDWHWETNFRSPYLLTQAALPNISEGGSVIFISSVAGSAPIRNASAYCSTKAALNALAGVLAIELAPSIRVNVVAPGFIETPMNEKLRQDPELVRFTLGATPAGRMGSVGDVAPSVVFLASDAGKYITGEILHIDGGYPTPFATVPGSP